MSMLDSLMTSENAAWLWDGELGRIVWANPAGIRFFGGTTLFDIIDLVFDREAEAVKRIGALGHALKRGEEARETLTLAGAKGPEAVDCRCLLHALADGRDGVLAMARGTGGAAADAGRYGAAMLAALPMAVAVGDHEGTMVLANEAARALGSERDAARFADILGDEETARDLMATAEAAGIATKVVMLATGLGRREYRITVRCMNVDGTDEGRSFLMLAEDVTERRKLERRLSGIEEEAAAPSPKAAADARRLSEEEARAFAQLGENLARENGTPAPPAKAAPPRRRAPVPGIIQRALDARPQAILIYRDDEILCVNQALATLLGHAGPGAVLQRDDLVVALSEAGDGATVELAGADGQRLRLTLRRHSFPWNTGPVPMLVLAPAVAEAAPPPAEKAVPAAQPEVAETPPAPPPVAKAPPAVPPLPEEETPAEEEPQSQPIEAASVPNDGFAMPAEELRNILDTASDGIITLDRDGHILGFSAGAEAIFGYGEAEVEGKPLIDLLTTASRRIVRDYLSAFDNGGMASVFNDGREVDAIVKQGGSVPLFVTIGQMSPPLAPERAAPNRPAFCVVVRDITQWKETESELRHAKEAAEQASRQKSEFLANISHELRTPLNAILGFSDVMRSERFGEMKNERYRGYANDIYTSGEHLLSLINDLLDLSKVEAGKLELNFTSVNLAKLLEEVIDLLHDQAAEARVVLRKSVASGIPNVVADLRSMKQILLNLVSNAIKFTDPGGQIVMSLRLTKQGELTLSVKDTGIGMDATELQRALEPFQRIESSGREERSGTGLGLPLTRALAEANRTRFAIHSEPKRGTLVEITFPVPRVLA